MGNYLSKKYIRNRLRISRIYTENSENLQSYVKKRIEIRGLSSKEAEKYIVSENKGIKGRLIKFAFNHKEIIKRFPYFGKKILSVKTRMLKQSVATANEAIDVGPYFEMYKTDFIAKIYEVMLQRNVDESGMKNCIAAMRNGASKGAIVYIISSSEEFGGRMKILNIEQYKKEYKRYVNKTRINTMPVLGRIISLYTLKGQINELYDRVERTEEISNNNSEKLFKKLDVINRGITSKNDKMTEQIIQNRALIGKLGKNLIDLNDIILQNKSRIDSSLDIQTSLSEKADSSLMIQTELSEKLDNLPQFIASIGIKNKSMVTSVSGGVIAVNADDFIFGVPSEEWGLAMFLSSYGHFEYGTETLFESIVEKNMTVLDIGANLGMFTLRGLKKGAVVYSYEPTPATFSILNQNIKANGFAESGRTYTFNVGVSEKAGRAKFSIVDGMCGHNSLYAERKGLKTIDVGLVSIDEHMKNAEKIDVIKMDIEGEEYFALKGMRETIRKNPQIKILMEFGPGHIKRAGVSFDAFFALIDELELTYKLIDEKTGDVTNITRDELEKVFSVNLFLEKREA